jgi:hypothetical protein
MSNQMERNTRRMIMSIDISVTEILVGLIPFIVSIDSYTLTRRVYLRIFLCILKCVEGGNVVVIDIG